MIKKIKVFFRRQCLFTRCKHNKKNYYLLYLKADQSDRGIGITTFLIKEALKTNTPIIVRTFIEKNRLVHEIYKYGQLLRYKSLTEQEISNTLVFAYKEDISGKRIDSVLIDSLFEDEFEDFFYRQYHRPKVNGFIQAKFMA